MDPLDNTLASLLLVYAERKVEEEGVVSLGFRVDGWLIVGDFELFGG